MELSRPGADLLGEPEARILLALSRLTRTISGREASRLAGLGQSTARRALLRLTKIGLIEAEEEPHAVRYSLNRRHALWPAVQQILASPARLEDLISEVVVRHTGGSATAIVFGSVARGDATTDSDIDVAIIFHEKVEATNSERLVDELTEEVELFTGNHAQVLTLSMSDLQRMVKEQDPLVDSWLQDARTITGTDVSALITQEHR